MDDENINSLKNKISVNESVKRSGKFALLVTAVLFVFLFFYIVGSVDPVGGGIVLIGIPFWALIFLFFFWPFLWSTTEFWRIMRHRSLMPFWPIRLIFAIALFVGPIFIAFGYWVTFFE
jgi:hypothetical protein